MITDRDSGRSRGFGFVNFTDAESANEALSAMDGQVKTKFMKYRNTKCNIVKYGDLTGDTS